MSAARATPFVGRVSEIARIREALAPGVVVTLVGPGGIGKTRLAQEVAGGLPGSVALVDAVEARDLDDLVFALAQAVGTSSVGVGAPRARLEQIVEAASFRPNLVLLMDNLEHLLEPARAVVSAVCRARIRVLATSRERLKLPEERCVAVGPLTVPEGSALYRYRAGAVSGRPIRGDDRSIAALVQALDGHPLSLELAAARAMVVSAAELLELHAERLDVLSTTDRGRHGSLRRCLDWTWDLLDADERSALARLTVLRGAFTRDAAAAVLDRPPLATLATLQRLCERNVLSSEPGAPTRFRLLEGVRAHAAEHLADADQRDAKHAWRAWVTARAITLASIDPVPHAEISAEAGDLRALARDPEASARQRVQGSIALALSDDVPLAERRQLVDAIPEGHDDAGYAIGVVRAATGDLPAAVDILRQIASTPDRLRRLRAVVALARITVVHDPAGAEGVLEDAIDDAARLGLPGVEAEARVLSATAAGRLGRLDQARDRLARALGRLDAHPHLPAAPLHLALAEIALEAQRLDEAEAASERALAAVEGLSRIARARVALAVGRVRVARGDASAALEPLRDAARAFGLLGAGAEAAVAHHALATAHHVLGDITEARAALEAVERASSSEQDGLRAIVRLHRAALDADTLEREGIDAGPGGDGADPTVADGYLAHRDLALARAAGRSGDLAGATAHAAAAARVVERLRRAGHAVDVVRLAAVLERTREQLGAPVLRVGPGARWFAMSESSPVDLSRKGAASRVLLAIVDAHAADPTHRLGIEALARAGWPGERIVYRAARDRVYTVIATLRRLGIREAIVHSDDGYGIDPRFRVDRPV